MIDINENIKKTLKKRNVHKIKTRKLVSEFKVAKPKFVAINNELSYSII